MKNHLAADADGVFDSRLQFVADGLPVLLCTVAAHLDMHQQFIEAARARDFQLIDRRQLRQLQNHFLDLRWINIHAAHNQHVVAAPFDALHAAHGARRAGQQRGQVAGAVSDQRRTLLGQRGKHQFAFFAVRQNLLRLRVDDFRVEIILPHGQTVLRLQTFLRDAGAHHFRQTVDVGGLDGGVGLHRIAHGNAPWFGAEDADAQRPLFRVPTLREVFVDDVEEVRRCDHDDVRAQVVNELRLARGHAAGDGNHRRA